LGATCVAGAGSRRTCEKAKGGMRVGGQECSRVERVPVGVEGVEERMSWGREGRRAWSSQVGMRRWEERNREGADGRQESGEEGGRRQGAGIGEQGSDREVRAGGMMGIGVAAAFGAPALGPDNGPRVVVVE